MAASSTDVSTANAPHPLSDLSKRALAYYRENLQSALEAEHEGDGVAIHPDTGDYVVAKTPTQAGRAMRLRHPVDSFVTMRVGLGLDYSLVSRLIAGRMVPEQTQCTEEYRKRARQATPSSPESSSLKIGKAVV